MLYGTWSNKYENSLLELSEVMIVKLHGTDSFISLQNYEIEMKRIQSRGRRSCCTPTNERPASFGMSF